MLTLGIDLGTTKVAAVLYDTEKTKPDFSNVHKFPDIVFSSPALPLPRGRGEDQ